MLLSSLNYSYLYLFSTTVHKRKIVSKVGLVENTANDSSKINTTATVIHAKNCLTLWLKTCATVCVGWLPLYRTANKLTSSATSTKAEGSAAGTTLLIDICSSRYVNRVVENVYNVT